MPKMTNFRSAAIATGNQINDSAYDNVKIVADNIDAIKETSQGINNRSNITYGEGVPAVTINPVTGTNALYIDTISDMLYACKDATENANVWSVVGSDSSGETSSYKKVFTNPIVDQTEFTGEIILNNTCSVFLNGSMLTYPTEYTVSNYTITLTTGVSSTEDVVVITASNNAGGSGTGGGQYLGNATTKAIGYMSPSINEDIVLGSVGDPLHGFAIDSLTIESQGSLTIEDGSIFKIL